MPYILPLPGTHFAPISSPHSYPTPTPPQGPDGRVGNPAFPAARDISGAAARAPPHPHQVWQLFIMHLFLFFYLINIEMI